MCVTFFFAQLLFVIGENDKESSHVVGVVISLACLTRVKSSEPAQATDRIELWIDTNEADSPDVIKRLGKSFKNAIGLGSRTTKFTFTPHDPTKKVEKPKKTAAAAAAAAPAEPPAPAAEGKEGEQPK